MSLSSGTIALIVVLVVAGFAIGNFLGARPRPSEVRTADLRLLARKMGIMPKLISCPGWLMAHYQALAYGQAGNKKTDYDSLPNDKKRLPMLTQYTLSIDGLTLPMACYLAVDDTALGAKAWQAVDLGIEHSPKAAAKTARLNGLALDLPSAITPHVLALSIKANTITLYWLDTAYQAKRGAHKLDKAQATQDLSAMKVALENWADAVQQASAASI